MPLILFYIQEPAIIIGKNQDYVAELNFPYVKKHQIRVTRRLSGGGSVYEDLGNLSFSIVTQEKIKTFDNFTQSTQPFLTAHQELGVQAELTSRNDLAVDGKTFSGHAQYQIGTKHFYHGTLMYDVNSAVFLTTLTVSAEKLPSMVFVPSLAEEQI